ncbi:hypothetical protein EHZ18_08815 [Burkholderia vietnamiensis]|nr:hypothetical protein EHZ18_08815 [Burkholderia vietnamiensis]
MFDTDRCGGVRRPLDDAPITLVRGSCVPDPLVEVKVEALTEGRPVYQRSGAVIFSSVWSEAKVGNLAEPK